MQYNMIFINFLNLKSKILHEIIFSFFRLTFFHSIHEFQHPSQQQQGDKNPLVSFYP